MLLAYHRHKIHQNAVSFLQAQNPPEYC